MTIIIKRFRDLSLDLAKFPKGRDILGIRLDLSIELTGRESLADLGMKFKEERQFCSPEREAKNSRIQTRMDRLISYSAVSFLIRPRSRNEIRF